MKTMKTFQFLKPKVSKALIFFVFFRIFPEFQ